MLEELGKQYLILNAWKLRPWTNMRKKWEYIWKILFESFEFLWVMFFLPSKVNPFSGVFLVNLTGNKNLSKKSLCLYTYEYFL